MSFIRREYSAGGIYCTPGGGGLPVVGWGSRGVDDSVSPEMTRSCSDLLSESFGPIRTGNASKASFAVAIPIWARKSDPFPFRSGIHKHRPPKENLDQYWKKMLPRVLLRNQRARFPPNWFESLKNRSFPKSRISFFPRFHFY